MAEEPRQKKGVFASVLDSLRYDTPTSLIFSLSGNTADAFTTYFALHHPENRESVPLTRWLIDTYGLEHGVFISLYASFLSVAACTYLVNACSPPHKLGNYIALCAGAISYAAAVHNTQYL